MAAQTEQQRLFSAFAELLAYPAGDPATLARRCGALLSGRGSAARLEAFATHAERARPHQLEELYASTFDLDPACPPYVGHHLCGDGPQRGVFLSRLAGVYRKDGFPVAAPDGELPDHLTVVLRYLATVADGADRQALLDDALVPALDKMLAALDDHENVYRAVLSALREEVA
jgi:nitrate reductase molybdenum cofactor assembly chaperone NarJ/NarW